KIGAFEKRMRWAFKWVSSFGSDFNHDFKVSFATDVVTKGIVEYNVAVGAFPAGEAPGMSIFAKDEAGEVYHTYSSYARGLEHLLGAYGVLDLTPKGRDEDGLSFTMAWVRHHDRYAAPARIGAR